MLSLLLQLAIKVPFLSSCFDDYVRSRVPCFSSGDVSNCDDEELKKVEEMTDGLFEKGEYEVNDADLF